MWGRERRRDLNGGVRDISKVLPSHRRRPTPRLGPSARHGRKWSVASQAREVRGDASQASPVASADA
eukprot:6970788-Pyramimonas_sp.AAC.1